MSAAKKKNKKPVQNKELRLTKIDPLTFSQRRAFRAYKEQKNIMMYGTAGTGKTLLAIYFGLIDVFQKDLYDKCVIFRSSVASRDMGFLPGNSREKMRVFEEPYQQIVSDLFEHPGAYQTLKQKGYLQFLSTSYLRGSTIDDSIIVIDEFQNMSWQEIKTICTRIGQNCRVYVCGDMRQTDINQTRETSGGSRLIEVCKKIRSFEFIEFFKEDILRSGFVKDFLEVCEDLDY